MEAILDFDIDEGPPAIDAASLESLQRLYSSMRFAAVLQRRGNLEQALARLRAFPAADRAPSISTPHPDPDPGRDQREARLRDVAVAFEVSLLIQLGERSVAATDQSSLAGVRYWREAMGQAPTAEARATIVDRVRETMLGRVEVLREKARFDEAIALLQAVPDLCEDDRVRGALALMFAGRGIAAANAGRWARAAQDLRAARSMNRNSPYINSNLALALKGWAGDCLAAEPARACALLREALAIADEGLQADPTDPRFQDVSIGAAEALGHARLAAGEVRPGELMRQVLSESEGP